MLTIVGMAVLGVDVGRLTFTANETQILADVGAAAGATALLDYRFNDPSVDPALVARNTVLSNAVAGESAAEGNIISIEYGTFDRATRDFEVVGGPDEADAIRVRTAATVNNLFSPILPGDDNVSTVFREAVGSGIQCPSSGQPVMPITFGDCTFDAFEGPADCSNPPRAILAPDQVDTACWTSLDDSSANSDRTRSMLPAQCCAQCDGAPGPLVSKGDFINVSNGVNASVLQALRGCLQAGLTDFTIPIVKCDPDGTLKCNQAREVVGFAKFRMTRVQASGSAKGVDLEFFCNSDGSDQSGSGGFCSVIYRPTLVM
jgi:hypothetical protein